MYPLHCSIDEIIDTMEVFGGSFVKNLSRLYRSADLPNQAILRQAFEHYFIQYDEMAKARKEKS